MKIPATIFAGALLTLASAAVAERPAAAGAADPQAPVAPLAYQSPFSAYRSFADAAVNPWKVVNDEVARIGGWKVYAREAYEASQSPSPVPAQGGSEKPSAAPKAK